VIAQGSDVHRYLQMPLRRKIIQRSMRQASAIITRSAELARLLAGAGIAQETLHPIYNGVDLETFRPADARAARERLALGPQWRIILFVGNFYDVKNPQLLVRAHADLCRVEADRRHHLIMIGGGPLEGQTRALADAAGFGAQVRFAG